MKSSLPPRFLLRLLSWFCPPALHEGIEGDLLEQFQVDSAERGVVRAKWLLAWRILQFFRPGIVLRNTFSLPITEFIMLGNYLLIAFRNIRKNKVFSAINVLGLALGLAACLFIFQFVSFEFSYDTFHSKLERTYRVTNDRFQNGKLIQHGTIMYPTIGPTMAKDYPEIEMYTRLMPGGTMNIKVGDQIFTAQNCHFTDEHFLQVFDFPVISGNRSTCLKDRYTIVLTETTARTFFGVKDNDFLSVIGKTMYWGLDPQPYKVTAVINDVPENSHIQFDALVSYATLFTPENPDADNSWTWSDMRHYLVLKPGTDYKALEAKFEEYSTRYFQGDKVSGSIEKFYLQPLQRAHLFSDYEYDIAKVASGRAVWAMLIVAIFILVLAWINYINLTTSRALDRAKEVGLRKVMGAYKSQLVRQFIFESVLISVFALLIAVVLVTLLQGTFNSIIDANLSWQKIFSGIDTQTIALFVLLMLGGMLLSGFYPAFVLSSYQPATVLKGKFNRSSKGQFLRKGLVVFQFTASAALITGTLIVSRQLKFMNDTDLGINISNTIIIQSPERTGWDSTFITRVETFKTELLRVDGVASVTSSNSTPGDRLPRAFGIRLAEHPSSARYTMSVMNVDYSFFDTYRIPILHGRKFVSTDHKENYDDITAVMLNVSATKLLGIQSPDQAVGKEIVWGNNGTRKWTVVGIINDYHQESLRKPKEPMVFRPTYSTYHEFSVLTSNGNEQKLVADIKAVFDKAFPDNAFQYRFLEEKYQRQYRDDHRFGKVISIFMILGIVISCLGLIALSSYTALQRTKEIGIRKVLGASLVSIVSLLSFEFIKLVIIATIISLPIAYVSMQGWLESYAYRININWLMFAMPLLTILVIAAITISFQVLKTAMLNPAQTLKHE
ncbi:MAG TPA: ABC transporter permease [Chryseosolibacter sp.]